MSSRRAKPKLSKSMTVAQFENGYWYATELKAFAESIGVLAATKLRKDELERAITCFLKTGIIQSPTKRSLSRIGIRDLDKGLSLNLPVVNYTSNKITKDFIVREAKRLVPTLKRKSGARYRLNRWREQQLTQGIPITYQDLIIEYIRLNQTEGSFARVPSGRYVNFVGDFLAAEKDATREEAIKAWKALKKMDMPKTYSAWVSVRRR